MVTKEEAQVILASKDTLLQKPSLDSTVHASRTDQEENVPIVPEKPSEDGYNWRKYGQKNVKRNECIRSYYKCSYPNCLVKKQVERSAGGRVTDITYLGTHDHPKPHSEAQEAVPSCSSVQAKTPDKTSDSNAPATNSVQPQPMDMCDRPTINKPDACVDSPLFIANVARDLDNENMTPKRRKKSIDGADIVTEKTTHDSRLVVRTVSEVDIVNDGYRWRKYGQKMVKGNPYPRSYYRCSTAGCPVKKHVERASHDPKVVITTYEGDHYHSIPPIRTVVPQSGTPSGDRISKPLECEEEKNDVISLSAKEFTVPEILSGDQKMLCPTKISDQNEQQIKHEITSSEQQMEDTSISTALNPDNIDHQTVKKEKAAPIQELKIEVVSTEQQRQRSDNGDRQTVKQEKLDTVEGMKTEDTSTEQQTPDNADNHQSSHEQEKIDPAQETKIEDASTEQQRLSVEPENCSA